MLIGGVGCRLNALLVLYDDILILYSLIERNEAGREAGAKLSFTKRSGETTETSVKNNLVKC
jgi:hypothetical protein